QPGRLWMQNDGSSLVHAQNERYAAPASARATRPSRFMLPPGLSPLLPLCRFQRAPRLGVVGLAAQDRFVLLNRVSVLLLLEKRVTEQRPRLRLGTGSQRLLGQARGVAILRFLEGNFTQALERLRPLAAADEAVEQSARFAVMAGCNQA